MNMSTFNDVEYMNGSYFSTSKYMNWVGFEIPGRSSVPV